MIDFHFEVAIAGNSCRWSEAQLEAIHSGEAVVPLEQADAAEFQYETMTHIREYKLVVLAHYTAVVYACAQIEARLLEVSGRTYIKACLLPETRVDQLAKEMAAPRADLRQEVC